MPSASSSTDVGSSDESGKSDDKVNEVYKGMTEVSEGVDNGDRRQ